ncbi:MAG: YdcF family protein [Acidobacteria bacterium]|nr:YdcF family protein [Acidobacteriota bacterium]
MIDSLLRRLYDYLNIGTPAQKADCIFVLAGRQERKIFGIDLWRQGCAPELILSVGRFEWRKFYELGLPADGGLKGLVEQTRPVHRHFFVRLTGQDASCRWVQPGWFGTWREAKALAEFMEHHPVRSILTISDAVHLRRVAVAFRRAFQGQAVRLAFVAVDALSIPVQRDSWWRLSASRSFVLRELCKYFAYRVIF